MAQDNLIMSDSGNIASFPYNFNIIRKDDGTYRAEVTTHIYNGIKITAEQSQTIQKQLDGLPHMEDSGFYMDGEELIYRSFIDYDNCLDPESMEVETRRHFIEDYLEEADDIRAILKGLPHHTLKTEFISEE